MQRESICFPRWGTQDVTKGGDDGFEQELLRWYSADEAIALEGLVNLKARLCTLSTDDFWTAVVEGISHILGAEMSFVMKRLLVDDQNSAVEMPPFGEPGSCLMAAALHYCTTTGEKHTIRENTFHAYACPCAYMRHDKIFVIPEDLDGFITNNPNTIPIPVDAYMAVPLFADSKCVAHFGVMWSKESSPKRRLSWAFVEMLLHALEDMIGQRILEGSNFIKPAKIAPPPASAEQQQSRVIPHHAISVAQSLRPHAGSLSHELRTPMQGVVGMLDVMYATVQDAVQASEDPHLRKVFQNLIESIEVVQDSSRRAVVAAENVVHAYDMNMSVPESAHILDDAQEDYVSVSPRTMANDRQPSIIVAGHDLPLARANNKRRRASDSYDDEPETPRSKTARQATYMHTSEASQSIKDGLYEAENVDVHDKDIRQSARHLTRPLRNSPEPRSSPGLTPTAHHVHRSANVRAVLQYVINEGLKTGGRPDYVSATPIEQGEIIEVRTRGSNNTLRQKTIKWIVDDDMPKALNYDEKDFSKLFSCLILNAIKFTDGIDARIDVHARHSLNGKHATIRISDNGPGMPAEFLPKLFQPFSQSDGSITRQSDGLGLGLMVAKGIARKLGGDLTCTKSETRPPNNGCEFEIKLPLMPGEAISRPGSPLASPITQRRQGSPFELVQPNTDVSTTSSQPRPHGIAPPSTDKDKRAKLSRTLSAINRMTDAVQVACKGRTSSGKGKSSPDFQIDRALSQKHPLTFLVAEDNKINRKLLVSMLGKFGYTDILEAHDGAEAVRQMAKQATNNYKVDVVLMDLWMPLMDGYEATERILKMSWKGSNAGPTVLAVTADVTDDALDRAARVGMKGFMTKPYKLQDLQRLITEYCVHKHAEAIDASTLPATTAITA